MRSILQYGIQLLGILFTLYSFEIVVAQDRDLQEGLTLDSLPPVNIVVQKTLDSQAKSFQQEQKDWIDRIQKSKLLPTVTLQYGIGESSYGRFKTRETPNFQVIPLNNDLRWQNDFRISLTWDLPTCDIFLF